MRRPTENKCVGIYFCLRRQNRGDCGFVNQHHRIPLNFGILRNLNVSGPKLERYMYKTKTLL